MKLMSKVRLYAHTIMHLKPSQIVYRLWRSAGGKTRLFLGHRVNGSPLKADIGRLPLLPELDFDPVFLERFSVDEIMDNRIDLLHQGKELQWKEPWACEGMTPLWQFNVHYCEFLLPLAHVARKTGESRYVEKGKEIIASWVAAHPRAEEGTGWDSYVISMRIVSWLAFYGELRDLLECDHDFVQTLDNSLYEQYVHLSEHLEKDILANHYLENLKAMILLATYFDDQGTLAEALSHFAKQTDEQILPDGMHFELSPMYQKVIMECLLRVASIARDCDSAVDCKLTKSLLSMADCLYSLERNINRTPLFNDGGDNVAKGRDALLLCAKRHCAADPTYRALLPQGGYCMFEQSIRGVSVKAIVDVGAPGPAYAAGHAHCDMLSFELFLDGRPWVVNGGTFAYQDSSRLDYKNTDAHNAPRYADSEQSECWASFRMARMARIISYSCDDRGIEAAMIDYRGRPLARRIRFLPEGVQVVDTAPDQASIVSTVHVAAPFSLEGAESEFPYAPEFGRVEHAQVRQYRGRGSIEYFLPFPFDFLQTGGSYGLD